MTEPRHAYHSLYNTARWRGVQQGKRFVGGLRADHLHAHPLCVLCQARGLVVQATVVDHIRPHKGDEAIFFDPANLQSLCKPCHDRHKQAEERGKALVVGHGADGWPSDPRHPWARFTAVFHAGWGRVKSLWPWEHRPAGLPRMQFCLKSEGRG